MGELALKICRFTLNDAPETPRLGLVVDGAIRDVTACTAHLPALKWPVPPGDQLIAHLPRLLPIITELSRSLPTISLDSVRLLSPVANPSKVICGAGNWKHHGAPFGVIGFMGKAATAMAGAGTPVEIRWPDRTTLHEPELAIIIGRECSNVPSAQALDVVAGYACAFDTTLKPEREDWAFCKSFDTYGTLGPWLVTRDEISDPSRLSYRFWVNDELRGERSFADLTGGVADLIAYASTAMTLFPGDIILSGAADVGPVGPGDTMVMDIDKIGQMSVPVILSPQARSEPWR